MKKRIKELWVKKLRSGRNKQAREELLNKKGGYCCLGVLCNVYLQQKGIKPRNLKARRGKIVSLSAHQGGAELTIQMLKWCGLTRLNMNTLMKYNDNDELSFKEIANKISKQY